MTKKKTSMEKKKSRSRKRRTHYLEFLTIVKEMEGENSFGALNVSVNVDLDAFCLRLRSPFCALLSLTTISYLCFAQKISISFKRVYLMSKEAL